MSILLISHSHLRWLILVAALAVVVKFTIGWLRGGTFQRLDRILASSFSGLMDLQAALGIILLVWQGLLGGFPMYRIEHAVTMLLAAAIPHLGALWKNAADKKRFRNSLFVVLGALAMVYIGVMRLPGVRGW